MTTQLNVSSKQPLPTTHIACLSRHTKRPYSPHHTANLLKYYLMTSFCNIFEGELLDSLPSSKRKPLVFARVNSHLVIWIHFSTPITQKITMNNEHGDDLHSTSTSSSHSKPNTINSTSNNKPTHLLILSHDCHFYLRAMTVHPILTPNI